jgi:cell division protein FtsI (penicillin-binding protein 3)
MAKKISLDKKIHGSYIIIGLIFAVAVVLIVCSAFWTGIIDGEYWRKKGEGLITRNVPVPAPRGNIYADDGELMATSENIYRLFIDFWAEGIDGDTLKTYVHPLAVELNRLLPARSVAHYENSIMAGWNEKEAARKQIEAGKEAKKNRQYRLDIEEVNYLQLRAIRQMPYFCKGVNRSGLFTTHHVVRTKPYTTLASRTIGDVYGEEDKGGKNGLELGFDSILRGVEGTASVQKIEGRKIRRIEQDPIAGKDIVSTIDVNLQDITERALLEKLRDLDAESGTAVLMETATGEIKAITNMGRIREGVWGETKNYAVSDLSEPGSTFKVASMMVALEDGVVKPNDPIDVGNGQFHYSTHTIKDHNAHRGGYGQITAEQTIWYSSNVGVAKIILKGYEKNPAKYVEGLYRLGFNQDLDLDIPGYGKAVVKHPDSIKKLPDSLKMWSRLSLPQMAYGYETRIPPIYTLTFFNAIANNGRMVKPRFVRAIMQDGNVIEEKRPVVLNKQICSPQTLGYIRSMLDSVVNYPAVPNPNVHSGTGKPARSEIVRIAGKTGTAQLWSKTGKEGHQVSFCGYFPADAPRYSCIVVIRRPRNGNASGGFMCGAVFKRIAEEITGLGELNRQPVAAAVDSIRPHNPSIKSGLHDRMRYAARKLDVACADSLTGEWATAVNHDSSVVFRDRRVSSNAVPNVVGMGARDAVFALESAGLRVSLDGRGAVRSQSLTAGTKAARGQTVVVHLQ